METKRIVIKDRENIKDEELAEAAAVLRSGGLVAFPTETVYGLGGNAKAAKLSGINTEKVFFWVYTNMGILSAIAGIVLSARNASATPKAGDGFEMDAIASCYIGGAATSGGIGTIIGAVVGAFIMGILNNGMSLYGWSTDIQKIVKGAVLLGAVTVDLLSKRKKG